MNTTFSADHWVDVHAPSPASSSRRSSFTAISPPSKTAMSVAIRQARALMATRDGRNDQAALEIVNKALRTAESGQLVPREEEELMSDADLVEREIVIGSWQAEDDRTPAATAAIEEDDADWDIPLVPRIIGLRNSGVVPPPSPTMSSAATYAPTEHEASVTPEVAATAAPATTTVEAQHAEQQAPGSADDAHQKDQLAVPPKIVPSEQEMAEHRRVADPLGELAASWLWKHCQYGGSYPSVLLHDIRSVLTQTMLNPTVILLALHYVSRLPIPHIHHPNDPKGLFRKALSEHSQQLVPYKLFCLGAMLANKWLDDNTFSNKTWHEVTQIPLIAINGLENAALAFFKFDISVPEHDWSRFLHTLKAQHAMSSPPLAPIGSARCPHALVSNIFDTLLAAGRPPTPASPRSPPQPYFIGKAALVEKKMREMQEREEIEKLDLDEGGPMRSEYLPQAVHGQHLASHAPLKEWSPADDPKVETRPARPSYIAIQRPGALSTISNFPQGHMAPAVDVYQRPYDVFNPAPGPVQRPHTYYPTQNIYGLADYSANAYYPAPTGPTYAPQYPPAYYQVPNPVTTQASGWPTAPSWNHQAPWVRT